MGKKNSVGFPGLLFLVYGLIYLGNIHVLHRLLIIEAGIIVADTIILYIVSDGETVMNYTYMVQCADGTLYTGWTNCLKRRLKAHNEGKNGARYTKAKRPVTLVYYEGFSTKEEAMSREYQIKQLTREKKLKLMEF